MSVVAEKLEALRARLLHGERKSGALLVVYPPEDELPFRTGYAEIRKELQANGVPTEIIDLRTLVFEALEKKKLLEKAFRLDAAGREDIHRNLAGLVERELIARIRDAAERAPEAVLCCVSTASLYPWVSYSSVLEELENEVENTLVVPFPGTEEGPALHFLGAKDGYNYRAARI
jgi:hypothetical protein